MSQYSVDSNPVATPLSVICPILIFVLLIILLFKGIKSLFFKIQVRNIRRKNNKHIFQENTQQNCVCSIQIPVKSTNDSSIMSPGFNSSVAFHRSMIYTRQLEHEAARKLQLSYERENEKMPR